MGWITKQFDEQMSDLKEAIEEYVEHFKTLAKKLTETVENYYEYVVDSNKFFKSLNKRNQKHFADEYHYIFQFKRGLPYHRRIYIN